VQRQGREGDDGLLGCGDHRSDLRAARIVRLGS
jgi:hypothetical protein